MVRKRFHSAESRFCKDTAFHPCIVRFSQKTLIYGVQEHSIEGVAVRVYSPAKTVVGARTSRPKRMLEPTISKSSRFRRTGEAASRVYGTSCGGFLVRQFLDGRVRLRSD